MSIREYALRALVPVALPFLSLGCESYAPSPEALAATTREARAAIEAYVDAVNALDVDSAGTFYSARGDFVWLEEGVIRYRSARESRESLAGLAQMASSATLTLSDLIVTALGPEAAVASCHFVQEIGMDGGAGFSFSGAMTIVLRKEDGRWLFVSGHTSSSPAQPVGSAARGGGRLNSGATPWTPADGRQDLYTDSPLYQQ